MTNKVKTIDNAHHGYIGYKNTEQINRIDT